MITGRFGNKGELFFEIELVTGNGFNLPVEAMLYHFDKDMIDIQCP